MKKCPEDRLQEAIDNIPDLILYGETQTDRGSENELHIPLWDDYQLIIFENGGSFASGLWSDENTCIWRNDDDVAPFGVAFKPRPLCDGEVDRAILFIEEYIRSVGRSLAGGPDGERDMRLEELFYAVEHEYIGDMSAGHIEMRVGRMERSVSHVAWDYNIDTGVLAIHQWYEYDDGVYAQIDSQANLPNPNISKWTIKKGDINLPDGNVMNLIIMITEAINHSCW